MGLAQSSPADPGPAPPRAQTLPGYIASYFTTPRPVLTTHTHPAPTTTTVREIASILVNDLGLPVELAQRILDEAQIWAACRRECTRPLTVYATGSEPRGVRGIDWGTGQEDEVPALEVMDSPGSVWCLVSGVVGCDGFPPGSGEGAGGGVEGVHGVGVGTGEADRERRETENRERSADDANDEEGADEEGPRQHTWVRAIVVETLSRDQGWADEHRNYGTYNGSFSWFELSLLRDGDEVPGSRCTIQHNVVAGQYFKPHRILLDRGHPLVRAARDGDRIVLWARALYPGWANHVRRTAMTVYTAGYA